MDQNNEFFDTEKKDIDEKDFHMHHASIDDEKEIKNDQQSGLCCLRKRSDCLNRCTEKRVDPENIEQSASGTTSTEEKYFHEVILSNKEKKVKKLCADVKNVDQDEIRLTNLLKSVYKTRDRKNNEEIEYHPLSLAALKLNKEIVHCLLEHGANLLLKNNLGDNVIHSLIRYAKLEPEKIDEIRDTIDAIYMFCTENDEKFDVKEVFTQRNKQELTPLQLAVLKNVGELCTYLLSMKDVYFLGSNLGIYERKKYDITFLDSITNRKAHMKNEDRAPPSDSVMEMIFADSTHNNTALDVVNHEIIDHIIKLKWKAYQPLFYIWMLLHFTAMIILTVYSIARIDVFFHNASRNIPTELNAESENDIVVIAYWLTPLFAFIFTIPVLLFIYSRIFAKPQPRKNVLHNIDYFVMYFVFVVCIFIDTILIGVGSRNYNGEALVLSVLCGWLFSTIFLRAIEKCGKITFLVRRVIVRDILGFLLVFLFLLIAFATCLHDLLKYKIDENGQHVVIQNFETFGRTLFTMFHAMLGLIDIDEVFDSRSYWLAITLLILFIIIAYGFLLNALIGIISSTSEEIFAHKHGYMSLHRLSVIIFMEEAFYLHRLSNPIAIEKENYFELEIISEKVSRTEEDKVIPKEREKSQEFRNVIKAMVCRFKCIDCKRRETVLAANENSVDYIIRQTFILDHNGKLLYVKYNKTCTD